MHRHILFLQGPITPFFKLMANQLEAQGCRCFRINLCFGDWLFWRGWASTQFRGGQQQWPAFIEQYIDKHAITDIVLLGEQRYYHKVAIAIANQRGIQVVTTDFGYIRPDWITFEHNGMSANSAFPNQPDEIFALAEGVPQPDLQQRYHDSFVRQVFWDVQYHLLSSLLRVLYPGYRSHQLHHPLWVYLGTGWRLLKLKAFMTSRANRSIAQLLDRGKPYWVFPLQMQNDFQIRAYSDYDNLEQSIDEVVGSFAQAAKSNAQLVIKLHPLDPGLMSWQRLCQRVARQYGVAERVTFIDGGNLDTLLESCEGVVTINSTVGIWSLRLNKPTFVLGQAVFNVEGLVQRGELDSFWSNPQRPDSVLVDAFFRALAAAVHIRGVYYNQPGLNNAVREAVARLLENRVNDCSAATSTDAGQPTRLAS